MRILVTGATGYLGGRIARHFVERGHAVTGLALKVPTDADAWRASLDALIEGDIRNPAVVARAVAADPDVIVHTVSLDHRASEPLSVQVLGVNVQPAYDLLRAVGQRDVRFVYLSTAQVYGAFPLAEVTEERPAAPANVYALTHLMSELIGGMASRIGGRRWVTLRLSNACGAPVFSDCNCWWLVANDFCRCAVEHGNVRLQSDGTPQRDFVSIPDVCSAVEAVGLAPEALLRYDTYNVGGGRTLTMFELAQLAARVASEVIGRPIRVLLSQGESQPSAAAVAPPQRFCYRIDRLRELGWDPIHGVEAGIREVLSFLGAGSQRHTAAPGSP